MGLMYSSDSGVCGCCTEQTSERYKSIGQDLDAKMSQVSFSEEYDYDNEDIKSSSESEEYSAPNKAPSSTRSTRSNHTLRKHTDSFGNVPEMTPATAFDTTIFVNSELANLLNSEEDVQLAQRCMSEPPPAKPSGMTRVTPDVIDTKSGTNNDDTGQDGLFDQILSQTLDDTVSPSVDVSPAEIVVQEEDSSKHKKRRAQTPPPKKSASRAVSKQPSAREEGYVFQRSPIPRHSVELQMLPTDSFKETSIVPVHGTEYKFDSNRLPKLKGFFDKKAGLGRWNRRFVLVKQGFLIWSVRKIKPGDLKDREERNKYRNKCVKLSRVQSVTRDSSDKHRLKFVVTAKDRKLVFRAINMEQREKWVVGLNEHVCRIREKRKSIVQ